MPEFLSTDWLLEQFGKNRRVAQKRYREFVRDGIANRPWDELKGQIYLGSDKFIERHSVRIRSSRRFHERSYTHSSRHWSGFLRRMGNRDRPGVPRAWVSAARDRRAFGSPLRDGEPKTQENRTTDIVMLDCKT